jgi:asparagine synthase (glutamine-hydrolysing)
MCGIGGFFSVKAVSDGMGVLERLRSALRHRGPDGEGEWLSEEGTVGLAHCRLAILDLSAAGLQPMAYARPSGTTLRIVFNGEIYNFRELRAELEAEGRQLQTQSDTEVLLHLYERDGVDFVQNLRGMFAMALWDEEKELALLVRDPLGVKPLYWSERDGQLTFASEVRALTDGGLVSRELDPAGVLSYFHAGSVAEPHTIFKDVSMLEAGTMVLWNGGRSQVRRFWRPDFSITHPDGEVERARVALRDSITAHLVSDVPVGVFLSGGIDSTVIAQGVDAAGLRDLRTFSIRFSESAEHDEGALAERTADSLGAKHTAWTLEGKEAAGLIDDFLICMDQPTTDGFNTFCVSKLASDSGLKVVLSGLGGDEIFGGYPSFQRVPQVLKWMKWLSWLPGARALAGTGAARCVSPQWRRLGEFLKGKAGVPEAYHLCRSLFCRADAEKLTQWVLGKNVSFAEDTPILLPAGTIGDQVSWLEMSRYMRHQLLRDSDVFSMACGLELRVPFVDRPLFEAMAGIPSEKRLVASKRLLTDGAGNVPEWILNRPKRGFAMPFTRWMDGPWKEAIEAQIAGSPVPLKTWYQKWAVFVMRRWVERLT